VLWYALGMAHYGDTPRTWFPEPSHDDDTPARLGEDTASWLARSTSAKAKACRDFLNRNIAALPQDQQPEVYKDLTSEFQQCSAFFELIVGRMLQVLGAAITYHPGNAADKTRVDYLAEFPDVAVSVEATSPAFDKEMVKVAKNHVYLLQIVESLVRNGWAVGVDSLPRLGPDDSKRRFKQAVAEMLDIEPPGEGAHIQRLRRGLPEGEIRLTLLPKTTTNLSEALKLASYASLTTWDDSVEVIPKALERKRRQAKNVTTPVLVAIDATGVATSLEEFDRALFGQYVQHLDQYGQLSEPEFHADGYFTGGSGKPTIAGVLAFLELGWTGARDPVLYLHPRFQGVLPQALLKLEHRKLRDDGSGIDVVPFQAPRLLDELGFVPSRI